MITQKYLQEIFEYRDGNLYWSIDRGGMKKGSRAGSLSGNKYWYIFVDNISHRAHRLIFLYHHGYLPKYIDHINGDKLDNRIENLRECTLSQNQMNRRANKENKTGYKGISISPSGKYFGAVRLSGKNYYTKRYINIEDAISALSELRCALHDEKFAR